MKIKNLFFILIQVITFVISMRIHILRNQDDIVEQKQIILNKDSKLSKVCNNVLKTYRNIGKDSMSLYKLCENDYKLLGASSEKIKNENPFCFNNLKNFFCKIKTKNLDETDNCEEEPKECIPKDLTKQVLSMLRGCTQVNYNNIGK